MIEFRIPTKSILVVHVYAILPLDQTLLDQFAFRIHYENAL